MITSNKEDYLKIIYGEGGVGKTIPNRVIAEKLGIAAPSVSEMLAKLAALGLITYKPYKGSRLTDEGLRACLHIVRSHRLWEVFLMRHLGYSWREAHEEAHLLEHISPSRMVDRLDAFLNYPEVCPHGSLIPQKDTPLTPPHHKVLGELKKGDKATICRIEEDGELLDYLERSGLQIGKPIQVVAVEDYEGPLSFLQDGATISISFKAAMRVYVQQ